MKKVALVTLLIIALVGFVITVFAQVSQSTWPFYVEVTAREGAPGLYDLIVPFPVMDKAREDLSDLRLYDANGQEIPYALRLRKELADKREVAARVFNQVTSGPATSEVSVDLGENAGEHNEVEIETAGQNFRRRVDLEGSDSGQEWRTLKSGGTIFDFESQNSAVESNRINYPTSRYRYLRARVFGDELTDRQPPVITGVKVVMAVRETGELTAWGVTVPSYQLLRNQGAPASAWTIDLGARVPCDRLTLEVDDESFSRPFELEDVDDPQNIRLVASGELTRRIGEVRRPLLITFDNEEQVRKLRLVVTDHANQTLPITSIMASAPARQLIFKLKEATGQPLRLFFGNPKVEAPHYDFEKELGASAGQPVRSEVGGVVGNPDYVPEPLPLTERVPWLIYVVLGASSLALAFILVSLARATLRTEPHASMSDTR